MKFQHSVLSLTLTALSICTTGIAWAGNLFSGPINSPAGRYPWALVGGEFNGDTILDLAVTNMNPKSEVRSQVKILLGTGSGAFEKPVGYRAGSESFSVAAGDFNGDGKLDLVVANHREPHHKNGKISVLLGNGDGTFQPQVTFKAGGGPGEVAVGDFNGDGKLDIVVTGTGKPGVVRILLGNGDGTFRPQIKVPAGHSPWFVRAGDLNEDGKIDLVVAGNGPKIATTALLGNGDGTFRISWTMDNKIAPYGMALGDFNGDGKLDLAETYATVARLTIRYGNGDGTFRDGRHYTIGKTPGPVVIADFDGDGILDIAAADYFGQNVTVLMGKGDGTFLTQGSYALKSGASAVEMIAADVNGDGKPDLVVTDHFNES